MGIQFRAKSRLILYTYNVWINATFHRNKQCNINSLKKISLNSKLILKLGPSESLPGVHYRYSWYLNIKMSIVCIGALTVSLPFSMFLMLCFVAPDWIFPQNRCRRAMLMTSRTVFVFLLAVQYRKNVLSGQYHLTFYWNCLIPVKIPYDSQILSFCVFFFRICKSLWCCTLSNAFR